MPKEFKRLLGNRLYLEYPEETKSNIHLDEASKAAIEAEKMKKWGRLKVYAVGTGVNANCAPGEEINEGDEIMIDPNSVSKVMKIPLSDTKTVLQISSFDVNHVW